MKQCNTTVIEYRDSLIITQIILYNQCKELHMFQGLFVLKCKVIIKKYLKKHKFFFLLIFN